MARKSRHRHLEAKARRIQEEDDVDWQTALREAKKRHRMTRA